MLRWSLVVERRLIGLLRLTFRMRMNRPSVIRGPFSLPCGRRLGSFSLARQGRAHLFEHTARPFAAASPSLREKAKAQARGLELSELPEGAVREPF